MKSIALLLVALWLPATLHCTLETIPGFAFLQSCCPGEETPLSPNGCQADCCSAVESGHYRTEDNAPLAPGPSLLLAIAVGECHAEPPVAPTAVCFPASSAPPELPKFWQFSHRTALPPRAPSLDA